MKLTKSDLLVLLNSYMYGNRMGEIKDVQKLVDKLLSNKLEIEGYEKEESFHDKTLSIYDEI